MKSETKTFLPEILANPISRNLIIILITTLTVAVISVTAIIMLFDQW